LRSQRQAGRHRFMLGETANEVQYFWDGRGKIPALCATLRTVGEIPVTGEG